MLCGGYCGSIPWSVRYLIVASKGKSAKLTDKSGSASSETFSELNPALWKIYVTLFALT